MIFRSKFLKIPRFLIVQKIKQVREFRIRKKGQRANAQSGEGQRANTQPSHIEGFSQPNLHFSLNIEIFPILRKIQVRSKID
jgi:hypothetical protein